MATLEELIQAIIDRDGKSGGETLVIANDVAQKITWGCRGGNVEFFPVQDDTYETRKKFIQSLWKYNRLSLYLKHIWTLLLTKGEVCFYVRPTESGQYEIHWFSGGETDPDPEFKAYYKPGGKELDVVVICYPYKVRSPMGMEETRWIQLRVSADTVERMDFNQKPRLDNTTPDAMVPGSKNSMPNKLGFVPCVVCTNNPRRPGMNGTSDYHWLRTQIERHDDLLGTIHRNLKLFANPSLVTTRSRAEILDAAQLEQFRPTVSTQSGYYPSTRRQDPQTRSSFEGGERIAAVISGVGPEERFGYISADAVSGDQNLIQKELREQVHYAIGGIDPLGINSGATAFEVRTLSGRVENTAQEKADILYTYGLCLVFEMVLAAEERVFKESLAYLMVQNDPKLEGLTADQISDNTVIEMLNNGVLPPGVVGLPPLGDRTVEWRYTKRVFSDSSRELLDQSIVVRNLREDGVNTETCLKFLFPDKTKKELEGMLTGFSPRIIQNAMQGFQSLMQMYQSMMAIPDPIDPAMPWAVRLGIDQMIERAVVTLKQELSYGQKTFDPADPNGPGTQPYEFAPGQTMSAEEQLQQQNNAAVAPNLASIFTAQFSPSDPIVSSIAAGFSPFPYQEQINGLQQSSSAVRSDAIPSPGVTVSSTSTSSAWGGAISANRAANALAAVRASGVPVDVGSNAGLFAALYGVAPPSQSSAQSKSSGDRSTNGNGSGGSKKRRR